VAIDVPDWLKLTQLAAPGALGAVSIASGLQSVTITVNLSPFATALIIVPQSAYDFVSWSVVGGVSAFPYITAFAVSNPCPPLVATIGGAYDNPVSIQAVAASVNGTGHAVVVGQVYQLFGTGVQFVENSGQQPLRVRIVPQIGQLGEVQVTTASISSNLAAGGSAAIVTGVVGQQLIVYSASMSIQPVGAVVGGYQVTLSDSGAATAILRTRVQVTTAVGVASVPYDIDFPTGLQLNQTAGIKVVANAGNVGNAFVEGVISYAIMPYIL